MKSLRQLLTSIDDPRGDALYDLYEEYGALFHYAKGSSHNHQAWPGGYADHIAECLRINRLLYPVMYEFRPLPFTMASADICLFFHDIEKPFKYGPDDHPEALEWKEFMAPTWRNPVEVQNAILRDLLQRFHITLTSEEENALRFAHGEGSAHRKDKRAAGPLAAHVHHCDNISARIWHDQGKGLNPFRWEHTLDHQRACVRCGAPTDDLPPRRTTCDLCLTETA